MGGDGPEEQRGGQRKGKDLMDKRRMEEERHGMQLAETIRGFGAEFCLVASGFLLS